MTLPEAIVASTALICVTVIVLKLFGILNE